MYDCCIEYESWTSKRGHEMPLLFVSPRFMLHNLRASRITGVWPHEEGDLWIVDA